MTSIHLDNVNMEHESLKDVKTKRKLTVTEKRKIKYPVVIQEMVF